MTTVSIMPGDPLRVSTRFTVEADPVLELPHMVLTVHTDTRSGFRIDFGDARALSLVLEALRTLRRDYEHHVRQADRVYPY